MRRSWPWFALALAIALADQAVKALVQAGLVPGQRISVLPFFDLVLVFNKGAAFSFLANAPGWQTPAFLAVAGVAAIVISVMLVREPGKRVLAGGLALILGGALGNAWDRAFLGHVVDFILLHAGGWHFPAFNVADSAITIGAGLVIVDGFLHREAPHEG